MLIRVNSNGASRFVTPASPACPESIIGRFSNATSTVIRNSLRCSRESETPHPVCARPCSQTTGPLCQLRCNELIRTVRGWRQTLLRHRWMHWLRRHLLTEQWEQKFAAPVAAGALHSCVRKEEKQMSKGCWPRNRV